MKFRRNPEYQDLAGEVTPEAMFLDRRAILRAAGVATVGLALGTEVACSEEPQDATAVATATGHPKPGDKLKFKTTSWKVADAEPATEDAATGYNNYYEFGTDKSDPARYAKRLTTDPWSISVEGETEAAGTYALKDVIDYNALEERIYRLRCVEAWSMVIPWVGVPMSSIVKKFKPTAKAKYVQFLTHLDKKEMNGTRFPVLDWPYTEGLRMDEAMNDLTFMAVGMYGKALPPQNGAPVRLVVPWKYGFKSAKSIAVIRFTEKQPPTSWNVANRGEYGFYSNVNPNVDHPRWSQSSERVIGGSGLAALTGRRKTDMFNGYEKQVAHMYKDMDLSKYY